MPQSLNFSQIYQPKIGIPQEEKAVNPPLDCPLCPRLVAYRMVNRKKYPDWFNNPVPNFNSSTPVRLLIVGLAPGLSGANRTGRPFTAAYAGDLLYPTLLKFGFAKGHYERHANDGLTLIDCMITDPVHCVPPENKPTLEEIKTCSRFLKNVIENLIPQNLSAILTLGKIAHDSVLRLMGRTLTSAKFTHGAKHRLTETLCLYDSYHCSRYNTSTGRLTTEKFHAVFTHIKKDIFGV